MAAGVRLASLLLLGDLVDAADAPGSCAANGDCGDPSGPTLVRSRKDAYTGFRVPHANWTCPRLELTVGQEGFQDILRDHVEKRIPVIFRLEDLGKSLGWQVHKWIEGQDFGLRYLADKVGDEPVFAKKLIRREDFLSYTDFLARKQTITMSWLDFLGDTDPRNSSGGRLYLGLQRSASRRAAGADSEEENRQWWELAPMSGLAADAPFPEILRQLEKRTEPYHRDSYMLNMWMGNVGDVDLDSEKAAISNTHYDSHQNFYLVLSGRKRFTLYSPNDGMYFFNPESVGKIFAKGKIMSQARGVMNHPTSPDGLDPQRFMDRQGRPHLATPAVCELGPGDVLILPDFWYHRVASAGRVVALNFWPGSQALCGSGLRWDREQGCVKVEYSYDYGQAYYSHSYYSYYRYYS